MNEWMKEWHEMEWNGLNANEKKWNELKMTTVTKTNQWHIN